ncbi:hypothetical protein BSL78_20351 [Apostichopus japonicus]|uniref:CCHC-type domain-containing protein n=1 Tax=Stichopus japonicus TaxID=307972 RepID=A0A2G8K439_STIJA|nr:hypothetical protein BSL78_20351 [Apostichopus japonicus]
MGTGPTLHTRASLALVGGVGWKGMRPGCARTSGVAAFCLQVGHTLAECKGDIVCNSCGKTGHLARLCPDRSYAARVATGVVEAVPVPAFQTVSPDAPLIAPVSDTSAPVEVFNSPSCSTSSLEEVAAPAETASLPTKAEQDKTAEMVLAEWHAEQDAACTGSPVATPAIGDTSRPSSQPAQETLSGPDSTRQWRTASP